MNRLIIFCENLINEKKELSMGAYYPANFSIFDAPINKINPENIPKGIVYFDYDDLDHNTVYSNSIEDTVNHLKKNIKNLESYELMICSASLKNFAHKKSKKNGKCILDDYNHNFLEMPNEKESINIISNILHKEIHKRMRNY